MEGRRKTVRLDSWLTVVLISPRWICILTEHMSWSQTMKLCWWAFKHQEASDVAGDMGGRETFLELFKIIFTESFQSHLTFWWALKPRRETYSLCLWEQRLTFQWSIGHKKKKKYVQISNGYNISMETKWQGIWKSISRKKPDKNIECQ